MMIQNNKEALEIIAHKLGELNSKTVFVGGSILFCYVNEIDFDEVRTTTDIDISFDIKTIMEVENLRTTLNSKGFFEAADENVICRFKYNDIKIDVLGTNEISWMPSNTWINKGFFKAITYKLNKIEINILPLSYFLATKIEAYKNRGNNNTHSSKDFEDIVFILEKNVQVFNEISKADNEVKSFIINTFIDLIKNNNFEENITAHLTRNFETENFIRIKNEIQTLILQYKNE